MCTRIVRQFMDALREKLRPLWTQSYGVNFKPFKNLVGYPRQCTRYGDMLREHPTKGDISSTFLRRVHVASSQLAACRSQTRELQVSCRRPLQVRSSVIMLNVTDK